MSTAILTLIRHDMAVAFKNNTFILLVCIPLFVYGTLLLVDGSEASSYAIKLGYLGASGKEAPIRAMLESVPEFFSVRTVADRADGSKLLEEGALDALLIPDAMNASRVSLLVFKKNSSAVSEMVQRLQAVQIAAKGNGSNWITGIEALRTESVSSEALPTWILMVVLLVAFFIIPAQVAEEKEKQWLSGLLQTPMREEEWLCAKLVYGQILMCIPLIALHIIGKTGVPPLAYGVTILLGSFCFSALGITVGLVCRNQATARTAGVICYLPLLLPVALFDSSKALRAIAPFMPSFALYNPVRKILLSGVQSAVFPAEWIVLAALGLLGLALSLRLLKTRYLMQ